MESQRLDDVFLEHAAEFLPERIARARPVTSEDEAGNPRKIDALVEQAVKTPLALDRGDAVIGENLADLRAERGNERGRIGGRGAGRGAKRRHRGDGDQEAKNIRTDAHS
jgi:hypothetical protein